MLDMICYYCNIPQVDCFDCNASWEHGKSHCQSRRVSRRRTWRLRLETAARISPFECRRTHGSWRTTWRAALLDSCWTSRPGRSCARLSTMGIAWRRTSTWLSANEATTMLKRIRNRSLLKNKFLQSKLSIYLHMSSFKIISLLSYNLKFTSQMFFWFN